MIVSSGWWIAVVALWPAADRPYIGSTTDNSITEPAVRLQRPVPHLRQRRRRRRRPAVPVAGGGAGFGGAVGWLRMFNTANGGQIAWLIPMAVAGLVAGLWLTRRGPRTDLPRAGWLLWGVLGHRLLRDLQPGAGHLPPVLHRAAGAGRSPPWPAPAASRSGACGRTNRWLRWALPAAIVVTAALAVALLSADADLPALAATR